MNPIARNLYFLSIFLLVAGCAPTTSSSSGSSLSSEAAWQIPSDSWSYSNRIMYVQDQSMATGETAPVDTTTWGVGGTDIGAPFYDPANERLYFAFGDTFARAPMSGTWNSNAILYTTNKDFSNGIQWEGKLPGQNGATSTVTPITNNVGNANGWTPQPELLTSPDVGTCIPTGAFVLNGTYYLFYMEVHEFSSTGEFSVFSNAVVKSTDSGVTWAKVTTLGWNAMKIDESEGDAPGFGQIFPLLADDGYVYIYGIPGGRSGGVQLGRVLSENFEDPEAYEYYHLNRDQTIDWRAGTTGLKSIKGDESSYIVAPSCGELSIAYNDYLGKYIMTYLQNNSQIVMRRSATPWGTWSSSDAIVNQSNIDGLYGGFTHPVLSDHNGQRIYLLVSQWLPFYNVHLVEVVFN